MKRPEAEQRRWAVPLAAIVWAAAVGAGFISLAAYSGAPGSLPAPPESWPARASLTRRPGAWTLVAFVHPRCPCSHASLNELARAAARFTEEAEILAVFFVPEGEGEAWAQGGLWELAGRLPRSRRLIDPGGRLARGFRAETSGSIVLYDRGGALRFHGGLTASRGHEGLDVGGASLRSWLGGERGAERAPVYGCPLSAAPGREAEEERACPP